MQGEEGRPLSPTLLTTWRSYALLKSHGPLNFEFFVILVVGLNFQFNFQRGSQNYYTEALNLLKESCHNEVSMGLQLEDLLFPIHTSSSTSFLYCNQFKNANKILYALLIVRRPDESSVSGLSTCTFQPSKTSRQQYFGTPECSLPLI